MHWARRLRWQAAVPAVGALAALAAAALPTAAQAAAPPRAGTGAGVLVVKAIAGLTAGAAAAQAPPPLPLAGATPAVAAGDPSTLWYTGSDKHAYRTPLAIWDEIAPGGTLVGGPGLAFVPEANCTGCRSYYVAYARGSNNALYQFTDFYHWQSMGGGLTSRPGVAEGALSGTGGEAIDVVVRGYDGSTYLKEFPVVVGAAPGRPGGWTYLGGPGRVLAGSGPAAVNVGGTLYVLVLAADGSVWVRHSTDPSASWSAWKSLGGRASGDVGVASPAPGVGVVFVRGPGNAVWYNEFAGTTAGVAPGWHSLGGSLTSGVGAGSAADGSTAVLVLGPNGRIYLRAGTWPALGTWTRLF